MSLNVEVLPDAGAAAARAAEWIGAAIREAAAARGCALVAASGGRDPWPMYRALAAQALPWDCVHVFQVDERVAPLHDDDRNWLHLRESLLARVPIEATHAHAMPVEEDDLASAASSYSARLCAVAGNPPVLDVVHLGLGGDGHTASLVPGDAAVDCTEGDVAVTEPYRGRRRMTLTFPVLSQARRVLWLVTGEEKRDALAKLRRGDASIPASRVAAKEQLVVADAAAAG
ncbi:MAG: 6-phosphogluconolactonase [Proteobacteria bacterium]|nr:MAG: 6-phosphogluconolactonase [Pseudomonadota bacterium]